MKRIIGLTGLCLILSSTLMAQQRSAGQWIGKIAGGANISNKGYYIEIGTEKIIKNSPSSLQISFIYNDNNFSTKTDKCVSVENYIGTLYYTYAFLTNSIVRISLLGGGFIGQQTVPEKVIEGVLVNHESKFNYGISAAAQVEFVVSRKIGLYLQPTVLHSFPSKVESTSFMAGLGVKYYF